ncbi:hypothetical protein GCM10007863_26650 [Dyella mobilis]|nr:hypothetical protein GCM10007863_26650 [Dyella mobilis]
MRLALALLLLPWVAQAADIPPFPSAGALPLGTPRQLAGGKLQWVAAESTDNIISLCAEDNQLALRSWDPATGATSVQPLGFRGTVEDQIPVVGGTVFLWDQSNCGAKHWVTADTWTIGWLTPQGLGSVVIPTPDDVRTIRMVALSDDTVFILERSPKRGRLGGYLARLKGSQVALEPMPELPVAHSGYALVALDDHRVMLLGGSSSIDYGCYGVHDCLASTHILDVRSKSWSNGPDLLQPRAGGAAFRLPDGSVLVAGGWTPTDRLGVGPSRSAERWDPGRNAFEALPPMPAATAFAKGSWLPGYEGRIVLFGRGISAHLPAFDVATRTWFDAGAWERGDQLGASGFFPFQLEGRFYAWHWHLSSPDDPPGLASLRFPGDIVPLPKRDGNAGTIATNREMSETAFLPPTQKQPALLVGGTANTGGNYFVYAGTVEGVTPSGDLLALPTLHDARSRPRVFRIGESVLVVGGKLPTAGRDAPSPPAEWLSSTRRGLHVQWQVLSELKLDADDIVGQGRDGRLFVLGQGGDIDQLLVQVKNDVPHFTRHRWLHLKRARRNGTYTNIRVRELADGQVVVAGGEVQGKGGNADDFALAQTVEIYTPATHRWTESAPSPTPGGWPVIGEDGSVIEVHVGDQNHPRIRIEYFNPSSHRWAVGAGPQPGFRFPGGFGGWWFELQGSVYLTGDTDEPPGPKGLYVHPRGLQRFDPATGQWSWFWRDPQGQFIQHYQGLLISRTVGGEEQMFPAGEVGCVLSDSTCAP